MTNPSAGISTASSSGPQSATRLVAWVAIVLGIVYLTAAGGGGFFGLYVTEFRIFSVAVLVLALAIWLLIASRRPTWRPRTMLGPSIVACLAALVIADATAVEPRLGFDYVAYAVLLAGAYLLLQRLFGQPFFAPRLGTLAVLLGFALSLLYIGIVILRWIEFWQLLGRIVPPPLRPGFEGLSYGNPSTVATVTILLWLAAAAHLGFSTSRGRRVLAVLGVLTAVVVFLSGSRGAWAGLAIAGVILVPFWFTTAEHRRQARTALRSAMLRRAVVAGLVVVAIGGVAFGPAVVGRLTEEGSDTRLAFYKASIRMFEDRPLIGFGPGSWVVERGRYTLPPEPDYYIPHAHNLFLQTLAELGLVGALAGVVVALNLGGLIRLGIRAADPLARRLGWAALAGTVYLCAHQLFDFYPNMPAVGFCLALIVARLDALATIERPDVAASFGRRFTPLAAALLIAIAASAIWLGWSESAAVSQVAATRAANLGDWAQAMTLAGQAVDRDPQMPPYQFTLGLAAAHQGNLAEARDLISRSAEIDDFPTAWLDLGRLELDLGNPDGARTALGRAMRLGYQQPQVAVGTASIELELGDSAAATTALAAAFVDAPGLAGDPTWLEPPWQAVREPALDAALADALPGSGYLLALEAGRPEVAQDLLGRLAAPARLVPQLVVQAWSGDAAAFETLHGIALADPLQDETVALCRRVAAHAREAAADRGTGADWFCDGAGIPGALLLVRVGPVPLTRVSLPGPNASWHFQYTYRRVTPFDELVPGLPHLVATIL